jgi:hypothetical protein
MQRIERSDTGCDTGGEFDTGDSSFLFVIGGRGECLLVDV